MSYTGGYLTEITCNHPTLGNFNFAPLAAEDFTIDPGGDRTDDEAGAVTGNGKPIWKTNRVRWSFEGPLAADFSTGLEMKNLPLLAGSAEDSTWTFTHISGVIWRGKGRPVGDIQIATGTAQITVKISGGGVLEAL